MSSIDNEADDSAKATAQLAAQGFDKLASDFPEIATAAMRAASVMVRQLVNMGEPSQEPATVFRPDDIASMSRRDD
jgi:hypothetical protein